MALIFDDPDLNPPPQAVNQGPVVDITILPGGEHAAPALKQMLETQQLEDPDSLAGVRLKVRATAGPRCLEASLHARALAYLRGCLSRNELRKQEVDSMGQISVGDEESGFSGIETRLEEGTGASPKVISAPVGSVTAHTTERCFMHHFQRMLNDPKATYRVTNASADGAGTSLVRTTSPLPGMAAGGASSLPGQLQPEIRSA